MKRLTAIVLALVFVLMGFAIAEEIAAEPTQDAAIETAAEETAQAEEEEADSEEADSEDAEEETGLAATSSKIAIGVVLVAMIVLLVLSMKRVRWNAAMIAKAAICIAMSYILQEIKLFHMPMGGSVCPASMLPLILFAVAYGPLEAILIGFSFGMLQLLMDPYVIHPLQLLVDYPMAYGAIVLSCLANCIPLPKRLKLPCAVLLGYLGKFIMAVLSGVVFFADYAGDQGALIYSIVYNISYIGPEMLIAAVIALIPGFERLTKLLRGNN